MLSFLFILPEARAQTINPTGRTIDLVVPIVQDGRFLGDATLRIGADDALTVDAPGVLGLLGERISPAAAAAISARAGSDGRISLSAFGDAGAALDYDPASLSLVYVPSRDALGERSLSLDDERIGPQDVLIPAALSGFANVTGGVRWEERDGFRLDNTDIEGGIRARGIVVEAALRYDDNDRGVNRRFTRIVLDDPDTGRRFTAGDYLTPFSGLVDTVDILGVAVENTGALRPFDNLRPRGRGRFEIERRSTVEIRINGILERRLRLDPGIYDLRDIPLTPGANDITIVVEDDLGRRELTRFNSFFGDDLLAKGRVLYAAAAGVVSETGSVSPDYDEGRPALSADVRYGLTDTLTVGGAARLTLERSVAGVSAVTVGRVGAVGVDLAGSYDEDRGSGVAANLLWQYEIDRTNPLGGFRDETISAGIGFRTEEFVARDPFDVDLVEEEYLFDLSFGYNRPLTEKLSLSLGAFYGYAQDRAQDSDRLQLNASLGGLFADRYTWGLRAEYVVDDDDDDSGIGIGVQIGVRLGANTQASASYNSRDQRAGAGLRHTRGRGVGAWSVGLLTDRDENDADPDLTATASYTANRFIASAFHREEFSDDDSNRRTTGLRFGTGIAFADGRVAVGRPIDGAFVIAEAHPSLEDRDVFLGREGRFYAARSDGLGPALLSGYSAYRPARVTTDAEDLPLGYDLGSGLVEIEPPYRAGYRVEVGSDAQITLIGKLLDDSGEPIGFVTGIARNIDDADFPPLQIFTNRAGRFALLGAKPGTYRLEISGGKVVEVTAPADALGLVRVGEVTAR